MMLFCPNRPRRECIGNVQQWIDQTFHRMADRICTPKLIDSNEAGIKSIRFLVLVDYGISRIFKRGITVTKMPYKMNSIGGIINKYRGRIILSGKGLGGKISRRFWIYMDGMFC